MTAKESTRNLLAQEPGLGKSHVETVSTPIIDQDLLQRHEGMDHRETSDHYRGEVFRSGGFRVAVCRDDLQWLFQRKRPTVSPGGAAWDTLGYCCTRNALMRLHREFSGVDAVELSAFPEHFQPKGGAA